MIASLSYLLLGLAAFGALWGLTIAVDRLDRS